MGISEISKIVSCAFQAGHLAAQVDFGIRSERVRRKEAEQALKAHGFTKTTLDKWVQERLVTEYVGESKNSARTYSTKELMNAITSASIKKAF